MKKIKVAYIIWAILVVIIIGLLTCLGFVYKEKTAPYKELEVKIEEISKKYVELKFLYPDEGEELKITSAELSDAELLTNFSYNDEICEGYVLITYDGVYEYEGFVKCDNYETKGY